MINALDFIPPQLHADIRAHTSSEDVTAYLQGFFDFVSENREYGDIPAGLYNISAPVWVVRTKQPSGFNSSHVQGAGAGYVDVDAQTVIRAHHLDGPALMIQRARGVRLSGLCIQGGNFFAVRPHPTANQSDYLADGVRSAHLSPHCGIAIDPTLGTPPAENQKYPALVADYLGDVGGSKNTWLSDISVRNFAVGIMVSPTASVQGEMTVIRDCSVGQCDIGISYGQPQSRASSILTTDLEFCRIAVSTADNGLQNGALQSVDGCQLVQCQTGFRGISSKGVTAWNNCYYEVVSEILDYGGGFHQIISPVTFNSCDFHIVPNQTVGGSPKYWPYIARSPAPVTFNQCWFVDNSIEYVKAMNFAASHNFALFKFNECQFWGSWAENSEAIIGVQRGNTFTTPQNGNSQFSDCWMTSNEDLSPHRVMGDTADYSSKVVKLDGPWTFTDDQFQATCESQAEADKISVGQLIFWEVLSTALPAIEIVSIDGQEMIGRLLFDKELYDETPPWIAGYWMDVIDGKS